MRCVFINLDLATARRAQIEASLAANLPAEVAVSRFPAVTAAEAEQLPGSISPAEKACFLSHLRVLEADPEDARPLLVLEDDAVLSPRTWPVLQNALTAEGAWDLLYTDVSIWGEGMLSLTRARDRLMGMDAFRLLDLRPLSFAGAAGYLVRPQARSKLARLLRESGPLDRPYDLTLKTLIREERIAARVTFPFVTTVHDHGVSQIQLRDQAFADEALNTWRRLMFVDADLQTIRQQGQMLQARAAADPRAEWVGRALWALTSPDFPDWR